MDTYIVVASRVETRWFKRQSFYVPKVRTRGPDGSATYITLNESEWPRAWGYETEEDAWKACDNHARQTEETYSEPYGMRDEGREDFHSDG